VCVCTLQPSTQYESKVEVRVMLPDRNIASVKVPKSSATADVYQVLLVQSVAE